MTTDEGHERQVLLVGEMSHRDLEEKLVGSGYDVTTVSSAGDCLSRIQREDLDGIISAYTLPDIDGLTLLRSVRVSYPLLPFVLVPESGSETLASDAMAAGASGYVPHDAEAEGVVSRIENCLQRGRTWTEGEDEGQQRYRHLIETSPAAINVFDENGVSIWCNQAVLDLLGLDGRDEFIGRTLFDVIHPEDHDVAKREIEKVVERKESVGPTRMRLRTPDGNVRYIQVSTAIGRFFGADIGQAVAIDVTDREERDRQLQILDQWLRHNIRNEMTVIQGLAEDIEAGMADDVEATARDIQTHATRLVEQTNHERRIVDVLTSRADHNRTTIDITQTVERQAQESRSTDPDADIELGRLDAFEATALPKIEAAVAELVENAVQHNDTDTPTVRIEVECEPTADEGVVRVADDGPGIPEDEREALLLDREIDQLHHGSGLGLIFVYWTVRLSGGELAFAENEPRGSVVSITLPKARTN